MTQNEQKLLALLVSRPGQAVRRDDLLAACGYRPGLKTRALANAVRRLRQKLNDDLKHPHTLRSVYGYGYRLEVLGAAAPPTSPQPPQRPEIVGREAHLQQTISLLSAGGLVTISGPAGVGKTTLARAVQHATPGAVLVGLSATTDRAGMVRATARALDISLHGQLSADAQQARIGDVLRRRGRILLILDNVEQLVDTAASTIAAWRGAAPEARFLITSRIPLRIRGEQVLSLPPLGDADAVRLLCARAPHLSEADQHLHRLVRELDGLPLAIEFAAAQTVFFSPAQLLKRLSARFQILQSRRRDRSPRALSLEESIRWSWELLAEEDRDALGTLSLLEGPAPFPLAEAVLGGRPDALERIAALIDSSMLSIDPATKQISTLLSIRAFARSRLSPQHLRRAREQHASAILAFAEGALENRHRSAHASSVGSLQGLEADLLAIFQHPLPHPDDRQRRAALALLESQHGNAPYTQQQRILQRALEMSPSKDDRWARLHGYGAILGLDAGKVSAVASVLDRVLGDPDAQMTPLTRAMLLRYRGSAASRTRTPHDFYRRALEAAQEEGSLWHEGMIRYEMAVQALYNASYREAEQQLQRAYTLLRHTGHRYGEACALSAWSSLHERQGHVPGALEKREREIKIWESLGMRRHASSAQVALASLLLNSHDPETRIQHASFSPSRARALIQQALPQLVGFSWSAEENAQLNCCVASLFLGDPHQAAEHAQSAADARAGDPPGPASQIRDLLAAVAAHRCGLSRTARTFLAAAEDRAQRFPSRHDGVWFRLVRALIGIGETPLRAIQTVPCTLEHQDEVVHLLLGLALQEIGALR